MAIEIQKKMYTYMHGNVFDIRLLKVVYHICPKMILNSSAYYTYKSLAHVYPDDIIINTNIK